jgi:hypothetical protein
MKKLMPFKLAMQEHIASNKLDTKRMENLLQMQQKHQKTTKKSKPIITWFASVAALAMVVLLVFQFSQRQPEIITLIADEVAKNHLKLKPLEVRTGQISDVQSYFDKLDFLPVSSISFKQKTKASLMGGRYCSIQGSSAAQLRYKKLDGEKVTLYETNYSDIFSDIPNIDKGQLPIKTYARGVEITMWIEKGLLMVTADNKKNNTKNNKETRNKGETNE